MKTQRILIASLVAGFLTAILSNLPYMNFINLICCGLVWLGAAFAVIYLNYLKGDDRDVQLNMKEIEEEIEKLKDADPDIAPKIENSVLQKMFQFKVSRQEGMLVGALTGIWSALISGVFYYVQLKNMGFAEIENLMSQVNLPAYDPASIQQVIDMFGSEARTMIFFSLFYTVFMLISYALIGLLAGFLSTEFLSRLKIFRAQS